MSDELKKVQKRFIRHFSTPPPVFQPEGAAYKHLQTPQRSAILGVLHFCDVLGIPCSLKDVQRAFNTPISTAQRVAKSKQPRTLLHSDAPDLRGAQRQLTGAEAWAIVDYIDHCSFEEKTETWQDIQIAAGVVAKHGKEAYHRTTIWRRVNEIAPISEHTAAQQEEHSPERQRERVEWCRIQLEARPRGKNWRDVLWCDELHWKTGPRHKRKIKRRRGKDERDRVSNTQYDRHHKQEPEDVQKERKFHLFCVLGYDFAWCMPYETSHSNGKMTSKVFTGTILPALQAELFHRGGEWTLYMDRDSSHTSQRTLNYMHLYGWDYILGCSKSPDLSIMETWVSPLKDKFYRKTCRSKSEGMARFYRVWADLDPHKVNKSIKKYPGRLIECRDVTVGRATNF